MKVLFDHGVPVPLRAFLEGHEVSTAYELGWATLKNGDLIASAATEKFDVLITTDKNLAFQQNLSGLVMAILVLPTTAWPTISRHVTQVAQALDSLGAGEMKRLEFDNHND